MAARKAAGTFKDVVQAVRGAGFEVSDPHTQAAVVGRCRGHVVLVTRGASAWRAQNDLRHPTKFRLCRTPEQVKQFCQDVAGTVEALPFELYFDGEQTFRLEAVAS